MPPKFSKILMKTRNNKFTGEKEKDIHENNYEYLLESYNNSKYISENMIGIELNVLIRIRLKV